MKEPELEAIAEFIDEYFDQMDMYESIYNVIQTLDEIGLIDTEAAKEFLKRKELEKCQIG